MQEIVRVLLALLAGWLLAVCLTWLAWSVQIEGKAFRCNDDSFPIVWWGEDVERHRQAGDTLGAAWSWERIRKAQELYRAVYYVLWASGATVTCLLLLKREARSP